MDSDSATPEVARPRPASLVSLVSNQRGMALLTVLILALIFIIGTMAFFGVAGYEAAQTEQRENSTRAFYLADGAIERAKARLLDDGSWRAGFPLTSLDGGQYRLAVRDSLYLGAPRTWLYAEGFYGRAKRDVEVWGSIKPATGTLIMWAGGNVDLQGNICLNGFVHANGTIADPTHFTCQPTRYDSGYNIDPPPAFTEPDSFPATTYYYVTVKNGPGNADTLFIKNRNFGTLSSYVYPARPHPDFGWSYNNAQKKLSVDIQPTGCLAQTGAGVPFPRANGDVSVVINFAPSQNLSNHTTTDIDFHEAGNFEIQTTIINSRFIGSSAQDRLNRNFWTGGLMDLETKTTFAPLACVTCITHTITGGSQAKLGTTARPGLTYVTSATTANAQWTINGSLLVLGDVSLGGGANLNYDGAFISCMPAYFRNNWPGSSGEIRVLAWREPPPR